MSAGPEFAATPIDLSPMLGRREYCDLNSLPRRKFFQEAWPEECSLQILRFLDFASFIALGSCNRALHDYFAKFDQAWDFFGRRLNVGSFLNGLTFKLILDDPVPSTGVFGEEKPSLPAGGRQSILSIGKEHTRWRRQYCLRQVVQRMPMKRQRSHPIAHGRRSFARRHRRRPSAAIASGSDPELPQQRASEPPCPMIIAPTSHESRPYRGFRSMKSFLYAVSLQAEKNELESPGNLDRPPTFSPRGPSSTSAPNLLLTLDRERRQLYCVEGREGAPSSVIHLPLPTVPSSIRVACDAQVGTETVQSFGSSFHNRVSAVAWASIYAEVSNPNSLACQSGTVGTRVAGFLIIAHTPSNIFKRRQGPEGTNSDPEDSSSGIESDGMSSGSSSQRERDGVQTAEGGKGGSEGRTAVFVSIVALSADTAGRRGGPKTRGVERIVVPLETGEEVVAVDGWFEEAKCSPSQPASCPHIHVCPKDGDVGYQGQVVMGTNRGRVWSTAFPRSDGISQIDLGEAYAPELLTEDSGMSRKSSIEVIIPVDCVDIGHNIYTGGVREEALSMCHEIRQLSHIQHADAMSEGHSPALPVYLAIADIGYHKLTRTRLLRWNSHGPPPGKGSLLVCIGASPSKSSTVCVFRLNVMDDTPRWHFISELRNVECLCIDIVGTSRRGDTDGSPRLVCTSSSEGEFAMYRVSLPNWSRRGWGAEYANLRCLRLAERNGGLESRGIRGWTERPLLEGPTSGGVAKALQLDLSEHMRLILFHARKAEAGFDIQSNLLSQCVAVTAMSCKSIGLLPLLDGEFAVLQRNRLLIIKISKAENDFSWIFSIVRQIARPSSHPCYAMDFDGGRRILVVDVQHYVHIWDVRAARKVFSFSLLRSSRASSPSSASRASKSAAKKSARPGARVSVFGHEPARDEWEGRAASELTEDSVPPCHVSVQRDDSDLVGVRQGPSKQEVQSHSIGSRPVLAANDFPALAETIIKPLSDRSLAETSPEKSYLSVARHADSERVECPHSSPPVLNSPSESQPTFSLTEEEEFQLVLMESERECSELTRALFLSQLASSEGGVGDRQVADGASVDSDYAFALHVAARESGASVSEELEKQRHFLMELEKNKMKHDRDVAVAACTRRLMRRRPVKQLAGRMSTPASGVDDFMVGGAGWEEPHDPPWVGDYVGALSLTPNRLSIFYSGSREWQTWTFSE